MSAAKPESPAAAQARPGAGDTPGKNRGARRERGGSALAFFFFEKDVSAVFAISAVFSDCDRDASHHAPPAAVRFSATPTQVVARRPIAGIRKNPAATAPAAAPVVFIAYSTPVSAAFRAYQSAAIGNVAPMAAAGMPRSARLIATRRTANCAGAPPSAYAQASAGTVAASAIGSSSAQTATTISRSA